MKKAKKEKKVIAKTYDRFGTHLSEHTPRSVAERYMEEDSNRTLLPKFRR